MSGKKASNAVADKVEKCSSRLSQFQAMKSEIDRLQEELATERMTLQLEKRAYELLLQKYLTACMQLKEIARLRDHIVQALSTPLLPDIKLPDEDVEDA